MAYAFPQSDTRGKWPMYNLSVRDQNEKNCWKINILGYNPVKNENFQTFLIGIFVPIMVIHEWIIL